VLLEQVGSIVDDSASNLAIIEEEGTILGILRKGRVC
jgi:hypothetical protein